MRPKDLEETLVEATERVRMKVSARAARGDEGGPSAWGLRGTTPCSLTRRQRA